MEKKNTLELSTRAPTYYLVGFGCWLTVGTNQNWAIRRHIRSYPLKSGIWWRVRIDFVPYYFTFQSSFTNNKKSTVDFRASAGQTTFIVCKHASMVTQQEIHWSQTWLRWLHKRICHFLNRFVKLSSNTKKAQLIFEISLSVINCYDGHLKNDFIFFFLAGPVITIKITDLPVQTLGRKYRKDRIQFQQAKLFYSPYNNNFIKINFTIVCLNDKKIRERGYLSRTRLRRRDNTGSKCQVVLGDLCRV